MEQRMYSSLMDTRTFGAISVKSIEERQTINRTIRPLYKVKRAICEVMNIDDNQFGQKDR